MNKQKPKKQLKNAAILSGIGLQMGITIYLFVKLGKWLDVTYNNGEKLWLKLFQFKNLQNLYTNIR